jgi:energy-coupling factor transporter ATP-binding protein EcfA2
VLPEPVLDQAVAVEWVVDHLDQDGVKAVRLTGPSGSGKSTIAASVADAWIRNGGTCIFATGDETHATRELYPLITGLTDSGFRWRSVATSGARVALNGADAALGPVGVTASIFDLLSAAFRQRAERALKHFSGTEREVVLNMKRRAKGNRLLVVADNAHWWDGPSLALLRDVLDEPLCTAIPALASIRVLMVDTAADQSLVAPPQFESLARVCQPSIYRTTLCSRAEFPLLLARFGVGELPPASVVDALYAITGGHLTLVQHVSMYLSDGSMTPGIDPSNVDHLLDLLSSRIAPRSASDPQLAELLSRAAVLGLFFSEQDLVCIIGKPRTELLDTVERAENLGLLDRDGPRFQFKHDVIRTAVLRGQSTSQQSVLYAKLADCLSRLNPGDYVARAQAHLSAGDLEKGRDLVALAGVAQLRRGSSLDEVLRFAHSYFPEDPELTTYLVTLGEGYAAVASGRFGDALPALRTPVSGESILMAAERHYVAAICAMEAPQTAHGAVEAGNVLAAWEPSVQGELELSVRFLLLLQQAQVLSEIFDAAAETEGKIERTLLGRVRYDPTAAALLQVQNRRSGAINVPEIAELRIREAVTFHRRGADDARNHLELFRALTNLSATQLKLGKNVEALAAAREAEQVAVEWPETVRRIDVLANNLVLAGLRSGESSAAEAVEQQRQVIASPEGADDKFLHRCNLVAYLLLAGEDDDAQRELDRLREELYAQSMDESYLVYYFSTLWTSIALIRGDTEEALRRHASMDDFVKSLRWPNAAYVRRRQGLLSEALNGFAMPGSRAAFDSLLLDITPREVGPAWSYYARLLPCSELSFWSDS